MRDVGPDQPCPETEAASVGHGGVPGPRDGTALEDGSQHGRNTPREHQGEEEVDDFGEGLFDAEDAQVEAEDGGLHADDDEGVDELVGEGVDLEALDGRWIRDREDVSTGAVVQGLVVYSQFSSGSLWVFFPFSFSSSRNKGTRTFVQKGKIYNN